MISPPWKLGDAGGRGGAGDGGVRRELREMIGRSFDYRYKLTAEVETPSGIKTGSSVIEIVVGMSGTIWPEGMRGGSAHVRHGEAVAVDLAPGQTLFVLLRSASERGLGGRHNARATRSSPRPRGGQGQGRARCASCRRCGADCGPTTRCTCSGGKDAPPERLTASACPIWCASAIFADPGSVEQVDPGNLAPNARAGRRAAADYGAAHR